MHENVKCPRFSVIEKKNNDVENKQFRNVNNLKYN